MDNNDNVEKIVRDAILTLIDNTVSEKSIRKSIAVHRDKVHFIPFQYRVLGGLIQSLNIKFGNFIEKLLALIIERDDFAESLPESNKKLKLYFTSDTDTLIDNYISQRQRPESAENSSEDFGNLLEAIVRTENESSDKRSIRQDVDALFRAKDGTFIYLEVKYNDDHDTGKFVNINRKFLKTYAGLVNSLKITRVSQLKPVIYYFNPIKRWGPIYVPSQNIYRGKQLFDEFFQISYSEVNTYLENISQDEEIIAVFDELYKKIRHSSQ